MQTKRSFRLLWIGQTLANSGDVFYIVGIMSLLHAATGSVTLMALVPFVNTFARFFGGLTAPWMVDRFSLKQVLVLSQLGKTVLLAVLAAYLLVGVSFVFLFIALIAFLDGWATPARNALLPRLVPQEGLVKANSFLSVVDQAVQLGGWPAGGLLVAQFHGSAMIAVVLVLFVISTLLMALIRDGAEKGAAPATGSARKRDSLKEGWVAIWRTPALRTVAVMDVLDAAAETVWMAAILYVYADEVLHKSEAWWGYINAAFMAGLILGGLVAMRAEARLQKRLDLSIYGGALLVAAFTLCFGLTTWPWMALLMSALVGVATQFKMIGQTTVIQTRAPQHLLAKVFSARDAILTGAFGLSSLLFGYLSDLFGVKAVFCLSACLLLLSGLWAAARRKQLNS